MNRSMQMDANLQIKKENTEKERKIVDDALGWISFTVR